MTKQFSKRNRKNQSGSMLVLATVAMMVLLIGLVVAASFAGVFFAHNRLQAAADEIALTGARKLNEFNRLGQMNEIIARSRQLVFSMNQANEQVKSAGNDKLLEKFAEQLNTEAMDSAAALDKERHSLSILAQQEAKQDMQTKFNQLKDSYAMVLPWLTVETPQIISAVTGKISGLDSNAKELQGITELVDEDKKSNQIKNGTQVNLYRAGDASLPIQNSPHFKFSTLPAPVQNDPAPARAALPDAFSTITDDSAPCATQLQLSLKVATGLGPHGAGEFKVASTAVATGGAVFQ